MASDTEILKRRITGHDGSTEGLSIHSGGREIRLKWHMLRRKAGDPPFLRDNLEAGLAAGASMEVDIQQLADGHFVCLHDIVLETETDGVGPVNRTDSSTIRALRQTDGAGRPTAAAPLMLDELVAIIAEATARAHPDAVVQLDLKTRLDDLNDGAVGRFSSLVGPVAGRLSLSGEDWPAVLRLGGGVAGLSLGFDPMPMLAETPSRTDDLLGFAETVATMAPRAETIYLHHSALAAAHERGVDLVGAFHRRGHRLDCWTIRTDRPDAEAQLRLAVASGVDQITTDTPHAIAALWAVMVGRSL